jgi:predicted enzyme related to lactoylglutathione lyase
MSVPFFVSFVCFVVHSWLFDFLKGFDVGDLNSEKNRAVWFDVPVADLARATKFYAEMLAIDVSQEKFGDFEFSVLDHHDGNGGCLVPNANEISADKGILLYLNADGRIRDAVQKVKDHGGKILEDVHPIGPHGFRAIITDSEGNRVALHSRTDA